MTLTTISSDEVRTAVRGYFADRPGIEITRRLRDGDPDLAELGFDRSRWNEVAQGLGVAGLVAPVDADGLGLELSYLVAAVEEAGASVFPGPLRQAGVFGWSVAHSDTASTALMDLVRGAARGETLVAVPEDLGGAGQHLDLDENGRVTGHVADVAHGAAADVLVVVASSAEGRVSVVVDLGSNEGEVVRTAHGTVDLATPVAAVELRSVPATPIALASRGDAVDRLQAAAWVLGAAEQVGGIQGCLLATVDYAKVREQFGRPIGSYQAIQHRCAETAVDLASARAMVLAAARRVELDDRRAPACAALARARASEAFSAAADTLIQVHGGVGFTWEHDAHLYFRRARASAASSGGPSALRSWAVEHGAVGLLAELADS